MNLRVVSSHMNKPRGRQVLEMLYSPPALPCVAGKLLAEPFVIKIMFFSVL